MTKNAATLGKFSAQAVKHGTSFVRHVVPATIRPIRTLWHEVIGFLFVVLAVIGASWLLRNAKNPPQYLLGGLFVIIMAYYGISSFVRARRISRS